MATAQKGQIIEAGSMKALKFEVIVENIPDTVTKDYRIQSGVCIGATAELRRHFSKGIKVIVGEPVAVEAVESKPKSIEAMSDPEVMEELETLQRSFTERDFKALEACLEVRAASLHWTGDLFMQPPRAVLASAREVIEKREK